MKVKVSFFLCSVAQSKKPEESEKTEKKTYWRFLGLLLFPPALLLCAAVCRD